MNPRLTDRERCLILEARVADLEAELTAWKTWGASERPDTHRPEIAILRPIFRRAHPQAGGPAPAAILLALLDRPGQLVNRRTLFCTCQAVSGRAADPTGRSLDVRLSHLRATLEALGFPGVIRVQVDCGWFISPEDAERLKARFLGCTTSIAGD